jgi:hypothetical protein
VGQQLGDDSLSRAVVRPRRQKMPLAVGMLLLAGIAVSLWLFNEELRRSWRDQAGPNTNELFANSRSAFGFHFAVALLGGISVVGVPFLLWERWRTKLPWQEGKFFWFVQGMASWLLWPPLIYHRARGSGSNSGVEICYFYGTPLMALYVTFTLLAGGRFRRARRRRLRHSWSEVFGLLLGLAWACTGAYLLFMIYRLDFRR